MGPSFWSNQEATNEATCEIASLIEIPKLPLASWGYRSTTSDAEASRSAGPLAVVAIARRYARSRKTLGSSVQAGRVQHCYVQEHSVLEVSQLQHAGIA